MRKILAIIILLLCVQTAFAAEYAVRPPGDCPNNGNGASWACAAGAGAAGAMNTLPSNIEHGSTYYIAGGAYGKVSVGLITYTGSDWAIAKKATTSEHGPSTGWSDDYASSVATFQQFNIRGHYVELDGVTGSKNSGHGIKVELPTADLNYSGDVATMWISGASSPYNLNYVTVKNVEVSMSAGTECANIDAANALGYEPSTYNIKAVRGNPHTHITIQNCYIHGGSTNIQMLGWQDSEIRDNYFGENCSRSWSHGQHISPFKSSNIKVFNNEFHKTTAFIIGAHQATPYTYETGNHYWYIYNNIAVGMGGTDTFITGGFAAAESGRTGCLNHAQVHHNVFIGITFNRGGVYVGNLFSTDHKSYAYNNLFFNCASPGLNNSTEPDANLVHDYNAFLKSTGTIAAEDHDQTDADADDPFTNSATGDYTINATTDAANAAHVINTGKTDLDILYKDDAAGNERDATPDIGAFEAGASADTAPPTISSATINAAGDTLTIAFSEIVNVTTSTGFTLNMSGGAAGLTYSSGSGTNSLGYVITGRNIDTAETGTLDYATVANGIEDASGNDLASTGESDIAVTNNSTYSPSATTYTVTPSVSSGGCSISPTTPQAVVSGETKQFTCTAMGNYACTAWTGTCGGSGTNTLTTSAITGDCTVVQPCKKRSADIAIY
jgi:hypothetical protein